MIIRAGRAFAWAATVTEPELVARRISAELSSSTDLAAALGGVVGGLSKRDLGKLRRVLDEGTRWVCRLAGVATSSPDRSVRHPLPRLTGGPPCGG